METFRLLAHPAAPANKVKAVTVELNYSESDCKFLLRYFVAGADDLNLPQCEPPGRRDRLWEKTCFELFVQREGFEPYYEFNFSPSTQWAAYKFDRYRAGMQDLELRAEPHIKRGNLEAGHVIDVDIDLAPFPDAPSRLGLSAVIEETDGTKSYWALAHPAGKPDFHHKDCFALTLPAPETR